MIRRLARHIQPASGVIFRGMAGSASLTRVAWCPSTQHRCCSSTFIDPDDVIHPDMVVLEPLEEEGVSAEFIAGDSAAPSSADDGLAFTDVVAIDPFAKGKILNYIRRFRPDGAGAPGGGALPLASMNKEEIAGHIVYRARLRLPVPYPLNESIAEGVGESEKDAEILTAMHAERVLDSLGVPLFQLPSKQRRHAEAARADGRPAPMPGDPVNPSGAIPPPMRMVAWNLSNAASSFTTTTEASVSFIDSPHVSTTTTVVMEDVSELTSRVTSATTTVEDVRVEPTLEASPTSASDRVASSAEHPRTNNEEHAFCAEGGNLSPEVDLDPALQASHNLLDPTEGNAYQLVNTFSQRFSPSEKAMQLPYILDKLSHDRIKMFFAASGVDMKSRVVFSHVQVPGHANRMHQCQITIDVDAQLVSKGKAHDKDNALYLAAMHAEMLIDATGRALYPSDPQSQHEHAVSVWGSGRWAMDPIRNDTVCPVDRVGTELPKPLKQQPGGDEQLFDPTMSSQRKSISEVIVQRHNELCNRRLSDFVEAHPDPELAKEAPKILQAWHEYHGHRYSNLFVMTRMGDYIRASTVLPVAEYLGPRGGNAVGRTTEQAIQLCALHAIDTLCLCNIPVFPYDAAKQAAFEKRRVELGLCVPSGESHPNSRSSGAPYSPGYYIEGAARPLPRMADLLKMQRMNPLTDFEIIDQSEAEILEEGNNVKQPTQNYCKSMEGVPVHVTALMSGFQRQAVVHNVISLPIRLPETVQLVGYEDKTVEELKAARRVLAVGIAPKKKDADRSCFLHAAAILKWAGVNVLDHMTVGKKTKKKMRQQGAGNAVPAATTSKAAAAVRLSLDDIPRPLMHPQMRACLAALEAERSQRRRR